MLRDLYGVLLLAGLFAGILALAEWLARRTRIGPEASRKLVHLAGGAGCLLFPLLLQSSLTVLALALLFGAAFMVGERRLRCLSRVARRSRGSVYYPLAIAGLFRLTSGRYELYLASVLVLTVSDTAAALVGSRWGRIRYRAGGPGESKSLEGSLAFWLLSFLSVFLPLFWSGGGANLWPALYAAVLTASLLTTVEAVAVGGRDNLYVPLLAAFLLLTMAAKPATELAMQCASMAVLFVLLPVVNRYGRMLRTRELMVMSVVLYGVWSLGSADWGIPMFAAIAVFGAVFAATGSDQKRSLVHRRMVVVSMPASAITLAAHLTGCYTFAYGPFLAAVLVPMLWGIVLHLAGGSSGRPGWVWSLRQAGFAGVGMAAVLAWPLVAGRAPGAVPPGVLVVTAGTVVWLGLGILHAWPRLGGGVAPLAAACVAALLVAGGQRADWLARWQPQLWADVFERHVDPLLPLHETQSGLVTR